MTQTVPTITDIGELTGYAATAAELRRIADALDTLAPPPEKPYLTLTLIVDEKSVDAAALAVVGKVTEITKSGNSWYHLAKIDGYRNPAYVTVQATATPPPDERDAELERLRAELAAIRTVSTYDPTARVSEASEGLRVPAYVGGFAKPHGAEIVDVEPAALEHYEARGWKGEGEGTCGVECASGVTYDGFASLYEAKAQLSLHFEVAR